MKDAAALIEKTVAHDKRVFYEQVAGVKVCSLPFPS
jgi:hypothetical protein